MSEKYDPMHSAEMSAEQNYNMIDGVLNNLPPPPAPEPELDRVRQAPPRRRSLEREER